ncbi:MAG: hypothetical protein RO469_12015 [Thermincola sp.]|nr:hypothetical protein [Thermincola sp.]MDT3704745.1 hypothetical protein [Thermincola sp.]
MSEAKGMVISMKISLYDYLPRMNSGEVLLTVNMKVKDIDYLIEEKYGREFFAKDVQALADDNVKENIPNLYSIIGRDVPRKFACLSVRTDFNTADSCNCYGPIVLKVNKDAILSDTIIFNGDVQNIAYKLSQVDNPSEWVEIHTLGEPDLYNSLKRISENGQPENGRLPRIIGIYFEARLHRALKITDIEEILIPKNEKALYELLEEKLRNYVDSP